MLSVVKMLLKWEVGLSSHGNYIVDHGKSRKNHGIVFLNFCGNPVKRLRMEPTGLSPTGFMIAMYWHWHVLCLEHGCFLSS